MFAAPFSYTLRGMTKLMEWRAPVRCQLQSLVQPEHAVTGVSQS